MSLIVEAGVDVAADLLARYDRESDYWNVERSGPFWIAVRIAHALGRFGSGQTIAIVDSGFDLAYAAVAAQEILGANPEESSAQVHGTVVTLLVREVAPQARLLLYPTRHGASLEESRVVDAIDDAVRRAADVVCLSLGQPYAVDDIFEFNRLMDPTAAWPQMTDDDMMFWINHRLAQTEFRTYLDIPNNNLTAAVDRALSSGVSLVAAAGNDARSLFVPAICRGVFATSFIREQRHINPATKGEIADWQLPTFNSSIFQDFALIQPDHVLGSSFSSPLLAGFVALMRNRSELAAFHETVRLSGLGSQLLAQLHRLGDRNRRREGVMLEIYHAAIQSCPHQDEWSPCPECALFAAPAFNNLGLFYHLAGVREKACQLLTVARTRCPDDPYAAANLGVALAALAHESMDSDPIERVRSLLRQAIEHTAIAVTLRPDHAPYAARLAEFQQAIHDPLSWQIAD